MKKIIMLLNLICSISLFFSPSQICYAEQTDAMQTECNAAVLMEAETGTILYEKEKDKELVPASITKIMTLDLIWDAIQTGKIKLEDSVTVSPYAASMGGSQVYLEPNETQTVNDMIKCISIASANDAAVAMAEKIAGSEEQFTKQMNEKAQQLGMKHTQFKNCTGLDDNIESGHYSSAYDVALMSRDLLLHHPEISNYSTVWMDSITHHTKKGDTTFGLTNTNKLVRFYQGITGLKTGSTSKAKYCLSASAKRNGVSLIAVIMAAPDHNKRFAEAQKLLDYGFANCFLYNDQAESKELQAQPIAGGRKEYVSTCVEQHFSHLFTTEYDQTKLTKKIQYSTNIKAPLKKGAHIGTISYYYNQTPIGSIPILAAETIEKASYKDYLTSLLSELIHKMKTVSN